MKQYLLPSVLNSRRILLRNKSPNQYRNGLIFTVDHNNGNIVSIKTFYKPPNCGFMPNLLETLNCAAAASLREKRCTTSISDLTNSIALLNNSTASNKFPLKQKTG